MSSKLALSAALSVLMMSAFVLFGADNMRVPLHTGSGDPKLHGVIGELPDLGEMLPFLR